MVVSESVSAVDWAELLTTLHQIWELLLTVLGAQMIVAGVILGAAVICVLAVIFR